LGLSRSSSRRALRHLAAEHLGVQIQTGEHCPVSLFSFFSLYDWSVTNTRLLLCWVNDNCLSRLKVALALIACAILKSLTFCFSFMQTCIFCCVAVSLKHEKKKSNKTMFQIEDARAAMLLYQRHKKDWEKSIKDQFRFKQKQRKSKQKKKHKIEDASNANHVEIES